jgi:hypothetical protein
VIQVLVLVPMLEMVLVVHGGGGRGGGRRGGGSGGRCGGHSGGGGEKYFVFEFTMPHIRITHRRTACRQHYTLTYSQNAIADLD